MLLYSFQPTSYIFLCRESDFCVCTIKRGHNFTFNLLNLLIQKKKKNSAAYRPMTIWLVFNYYFLLVSIPALHSWREVKACFFYPIRLLKVRGYSVKIRQGRSIFVKSMLMQKQIQNQFYNESL